MTDRNRIVSSYLIQKLDKIECSLKTWHLTHYFVDIKFAFLRHHQTVDINVQYLLSEGILKTNLATFATFSEYNVTTVRNSGDVID